MEQEPLPTGRPSQLSSKPEPAPSGAIRPAPSPTPDNLPPNPVTVEDLPEETEPPKKDTDGFKSIFSTILILIMAPLIAIGLTTFVFQSYEVDGESMETTLQHRDRLIVWKMPRTFATIRNKDYIPERGEIVIFSRHGYAQLGTTSDKQLIKRVIALPGERVVIRDGKAVVYNSEHPEGFDPETGLDDFGPAADRTQGLIDLHVADGEVFVLGDNRANSSDSRAFGTVPSDDIVGTLALRIFPFDKFQAY